MDERARVIVSTLGLPFQSRGEHYDFYLRAIRAGKPTVAIARPTMPDPDRVAREWMAYHRTMAGMYFQTHVGYDYSLGAAAELAWSDFRIYVPQGYRVKLGRVAYSLSNIYLRMRVSMTNTWESSASYGVGTVNMTLEPTSTTSGAYRLATVSTRNSGGSTYTLGKRDSITLALFVLPF